MAKPIYVRNGISYSLVEPNHAQNLSVKAKQSAAQQDSRFLQPTTPVKGGINTDTDPRFQAPSSASNVTRVPDKNLNARDVPLLENTVNKDNNTGGDDGSNGGGGVGGGYTPGTAMFTPSQTYLKAMEYTNSLLEQLSGGRTSYTDKINALMDQIMNREKFSYDPSADGLFQNMLSGYMAAGQTAMQDTIGQAASLTGGYGSSYATSAANQAYNAYIQDAYNNLPDYYNMALDAYNQEGQELYNQLGMYEQADETEYNRLANAYSANLQSASNLYDQEYNNFWQTANFNENQRQFAAEMGYKYSKAAQDQKNWEKEYALSILKADDAAAPSATDKKAAFADLLASANKGGINSDQFAESMALYESQGYDFDEMYNYVVNNMDSASYSLGQGGQYTDQWGGTIDDAPTFTLVETKNDKNNNVYEDQFHNKYTRIQLEQMGYTFDRNGKQKK